MSHDLLRLYQQIQKTPALSVDFPEESGTGRITRLDTRTFSLAAWNMEFRRETRVEGCVSKDVRLLFCRGDGVEWLTGRGSMRLDTNEACFCLSDGSPERMCYQSKSPFSFLTVSMPLGRFAGLTGDYLPEADNVIDCLNGRRFNISAAIQKILHDLDALEAVHSGFEMMRLDARLLESLSLCLQAGLCEPLPQRRLHPDDLKAIREIGNRIEANPAAIPDAAALAREHCMSVSKLTRIFRQVYGAPLHACVIEARLQRGAELLTHDEISIQEIAERLGYVKPSQFSADFKKRFGLLPGEYRLRR